MRKDALEADSFLPTSDSLSGECEEEFDPLHKAVEEPLAFRVDFMHKAVEGLLVTGNEADEELNSTGRILLAH